MLDMTVEELAELKQSFFEYLPRFSGGLYEVVISFQQGNKDAYSKIVDLIEGLEWIIVVATNLYSNQPELLPNEQLAKILADLTEGVGSSDSVMIADTLEYELNPIIETLRKNA